MIVGQYIYLKATANYAEIYDAPTIASSPLGFTSGYVGLVKKLNVEGVADPNTFTEILDETGKTKYINNNDEDSFEFTSTKKDDAVDTGGTGGVDSGGTGGSSSGGSSTFDKLFGAISGILGVFSKSKTITGTTTTGGTSTGSGSGTGGTDTTKDPKTGNDDKSSFAVWFANNWYWAVPAIILIPGGIIWAIVASSKKAKMKMMNSNNLNSTPPKQIQ